METLWKRCWHVSHVSLWPKEALCTFDRNFVDIRVVIGKAAAAATDYRPQPGTSPLYELCKLQTLMLRDLDQVQLREVVCVKQSV